MTVPFASMTDAANLGYQVTTPALNRATIRIRTYLRNAGYLNDPDPIPEGLVDLTCAVAQRLGSMPQALIEGQQQQSQGAGVFNQSVGYGWDAWKAKSGLDAGETAELKRLFPQIPRSITMGSPVDLHLDEA